MRGLVPCMSDMSVEPFWCDCRIGSYMIRYNGYCHSLNGGTWLVARNTQSRTEDHSDLTMGCSLTWSDMSEWSFWCDWGMCSHLIRYKGWCHYLGEWRYLVSYQEYSVWDWGPFWCDCRIGSYMIRYRGYCHSLNGGTWSVTRKNQSIIEGHSDMTVRCVLTWLDMSAWPFWCDWGMCSHLIRYKGCFHPLNGGTWSITRNPQSGTVIADFTTLGESQLYGIPLSLCRLLRPIRPFFFLWCFLDHP